MIPAGAAVPAAGGNGVHLVSQQRVGNLGSVSGAAGIARSQEVAVGGAQDQVGIETVGLQGDLQGARTVRGYGVAIEGRTVRKQAAAGRKIAGERLIQADRGEVPAERSRL